MTYYKIPKKKLQDFYLKNKIDNDIIPNKIIPINEFNLINEYITYNADTFDVINHNYGSSLTYIKSTLNNTHSQTELQKSFGYTNAKEFTKHIVKIQSTNLELSDIQALTNFIYNKTDNYAVNNFKQNLSNIIIFNYLITDKKYENFLSIVNLANEEKQNSIIDIDFGNETNITIQPFNNTEGINQIYSSFYNNNIDSLIIHSKSSIQVIADSLNIKPNESTDEEVAYILNNKRETISFMDIINSQNYILEDKSLFFTKDIDPFEQIIKIMNDQERMTDDSFFNLFTQIIESYISNENKHDIQYEIILNSTNYLLEHYNENLENLYINYIDEKIQNINENRHNINILKILSPNSQFIGEILIKKFSDDFHLNLIEKIGLVKTGFIYSNFLTAENSKKNTIDLVENSLSNTHCLNKKRKTKKELLKNIEEGYSTTIKDYGYLNPKGLYVISQILEKISENNSNIYKDFNSSHYFLKLQKDIFPLLEFKDKINFNNYECFIKDGLEGLHFSHISSIPISLWYNEDILKHISKEYLNTDKIIKNSNYNEFYLNSEYFAPAYYEVFSNILEDDTNNKKSFSLLDKEQIIYTQGYKNYFSEQIIKDPNIVKTINHLNEQSLLYKHKNLEPNFDFFAKNILENNNKDISYFKTIKILYLSKPERFNYRDFLSVFSTEPNIQLMDDLNHQIIMSIYKKDNSSIHKNSSSNLIEFILSPEVVKEIISYHKENQTISRCSGFDTSDGFKNSSFNDCFISKKQLKNIVSFGFDLFYLSPSLINELPTEQAKIEKDWIKTININFIVNNGRCVLNIPNHITKNYQIFNEIYDNYLELFNDKNKNNSYFTSLIEKGNVISQFPHLFLNKEEQILKTLKFLSHNYNTPVINNFLKATSKINPKFESFIENVSNINSNTNPFEQAILNLENISMSRKILLNEATIKSKTVKF